jgi:Mg-chelatase subunit ChlD
MESRMNRQPSYGKLWLRGMGLAALLGGLVASCVSQAPAGSPMLNTGPTYTGSDGKSEPKFPNVDVVYSLIGADGNPVAAKPGDLKLFSQGSEIGTANSIRTFEKTGYGLTAILALDASGSMRGAPINAIHASIARFVNQARSQDKVAVLTFADDTRTDVPFGAPQSAITKELETVQPRGRFTRLYDGLLVALGQFNSSQPKRRQLVVISDGHDEGSQLAAKEGPDKAIGEVIVKAKSLGVVIDCIGLTKDRGEYLVSLQRLAKETGGTYRRSMLPQDLDTFIGQGIAATRATPVASFKTAHLAGDGTLHPAQLRWVPGNLPAPAFIQTPKSTAVSNPWIWGLGACFLAGLILLGVSWFGSRRKTGAKAQPASAAPQPPVPPAPSAPPTPASVTQRASQVPAGTGGIGANSGPAGRTPTQPETGPRPPLYPRTPTPTPIPTTVEAPSHFASVGQAPEKDRSKTQLAVFFEAPDQGPFARIVVESGDLADHAIPMTATPFTIGALAGNHLILPEDPTISGQHARLLWESSILKVEDMNSTNGTSVNSVRLSPGRHLLRPGDRIQIGQTILLIDRV